MPILCEYTHPQEEIKNMPAILTMVDEVIATVPKALGNLKYIYIFI